MSFSTAYFVAEYAQIGRLLTLACPCAQEDDYRRMRDRSRCGKLIAICSAVKRADGLFPVSSVVAKVMQSMPDELEGFPDTWNALIEAHVIEVVIPGSPYFYRINHEVADILEGSVARA